MRLAPAFALAVVTVLALGACQQQSTPIVPTPAPSASPLFASDEEALAAAEEAFSSYLAVLDSIRHDGGDAIERLNDVASADVISHESQGLNEMKASGERTTGLTQFDSMSIQSRALDSGQGEKLVVVYVCEDFSETDVLGPEGKSILGADRQTRWPLEVSFDAKAPGELPLIVSSVENWTGVDFCQP